MPTLITLVGEQPIPSLLPIRHLQPERVFLVHTTGNSGTEAVAQRVADVGPAIHSPRAVACWYRCSAARMDAPSKYHILRWAGCWWR